MSAFFHIETDLDCKLYKFGEEIATIYAGRDNVISFHQGRLKLEFVALMHSEIREQMTISIPSEEYEDFIEVKLRSRQKALIPKSLEDYSRQKVDELVSIYSEHNNRLLCRINRKYGYTDASGEIVIPCQYGFAKEFDIPFDTSSDFKWGLAIATQCRHLELTDSELSEDNSNNDMFNSVTTFIIPSINGNRKRNSR